MQEVTHNVDASIYYPCVIAYGFLVQDGPKPASMAVDEAAPVKKVEAVPTDLYKRYKELQKQLEFLNVQEEYIKDEMKV